MGAKAPFQKSVGAAAPTAPIQMIKTLLTYCIFFRQRESADESKQRKASAADYIRKIRSVESDSSQQSRLETERNRQRTYRAVLSNGKKPNVGKKQREATSVAENELPGETSLRNSAAEPIQVVLEVPKN